MSLARKWSQQPTSRENRTLHARTLCKSCFGSSKTHSSRPSFLDSSGNFIHSTRRLDERAIVWSWFENAADRLFKKASQQGHRSDANLVREESLISRLHITRYASRITSRPYLYCEVWAAQMTTKTPSRTGTSSELMRVSDRMRRANSWIAAMAGSCDGSTGRKAMP